MGAGVGSSVGDIIILSSPPVPGALIETPGVFVGSRSVPSAPGEVLASPDEQARRAVVNNALPEAKTLPFIDLKFSGSEYLEALFSTKLLYQIL